MFLFFSCVLAALKPENIETAEKKKRWRTGRIFDD